MPNDRKDPKAPSTFTRGTQVPSQNKTPKMPSVKPPASKNGSKAQK